VSGEGRLVWRTSDRPTYDRRSIVIEYIGAMRSGRPNGRGHYRDESGVDFEGEWADGVMQGQGRLRLPNGDEYQGEFRGGRPHGRGRYIDAAGEIYNGPFATGRRDGIGTTTLVNGTAYQSEWRDGKELASSRYVRLAQNRNAPTFGMPTASDLQLNLLVAPVRPGIFKAETNEAASAAREALGYVGSNTERGLVIRPDKERLIGMWKGNAEIQLTEKEETVHDVAEASYGVFSLGKTLLPPLDITVEVANRATAPVQVTGAYLDVSRSVTDLQPAIQVSLLARKCSFGSDTGCSPYSPRLGFENFGWGSARNARLRFSFVAPNNKSMPDHFDITKPLADLNRRLDVDFEPELKAAGADTGFLAKEAKTRGFRCDIERIENCIVKIGGSKVFGSLADKVSLVPPGFPGSDDVPRLVTMAAGVLEYQWIDAAGQMHTRVSPFRDILWLGHVYYEAEKGEGSGTERPIRKTIQLLVDRSDYRIALPFQREVPAGRVVAYSLPIEAPRASEHDFTLVLQLADGREIRSRPIHLLYFIPSWEPKFGS
jgi:hypothetical protein